MAEKPGYFKERMMEYTELGKREAEMNGWEGKKVTRIYTIIQKLIHFNLFFQKEREREGGERNKRRNKQGKEAGE